MLDNLFKFVSIVEHRFHIMSRALNNLLKESFYFVMNASKIMFNDN